MSRELRSRLEQLQAEVRELTDAPLKPGDRASVAAEIARERAALAARLDAATGAVASLEQAVAAARKKGPSETDRSWLAAVALLSLLYTFVIGLLSLVALLASSQGAGLAVALIIVGLALFVWGREAR